MHSFLLLSPVINILYQLKKKKQKEAVQTTFKAEQTLL